MISITAKFFYYYKRRRGYSLIGRAVVFKIISIGSSPIIPDTMPQVDNTIFLPIIMSLFKCCSLCYGFILVYVFYPFVTKIKITYAFFNKIKQLKNILINMF